MDSSAITFLSGHNITCHALISLSVQTMHSGVDDVDSIVKQIKPALCL